MDRKLSVGLGAGLGVVAKGKILVYDGNWIPVLQFMRILLLALTRRSGVESHVSTTVSVITDWYMTMEFASETSDFYTVLRLLHRSS